MSKSPAPIGFVSMLRRRLNKCGKEIIINSKTVLCDKDRDHKDDCDYNGGWGWSNGKRN